MILIPHFSHYFSRWRWISGVLPLLLPFAAVVQGLMIVSYDQYPPAVLGASTAILPKQAVIAHYTTFTIGIIGLFARMQRFVGSFLSLWTSNEPFAKSPYYLSYEQYPPALLGALTAIPSKFLVFLKRWHGI